MRPPASGRGLGGRALWAALLAALLLLPPASQATAPAVALDLLAGPLTQADEADRVAPTADPASLRLRDQRIRGRLVWSQAGVPDQQIEWAVRAWDATVAALPAAGLAAPGDPLALYLFADGDAFRHLTSELTGLPLSAIHGFEGGRSYAAGPPRGVYVNAGAIASAAQAARLVAHELVHLAERDAIGNRTVPRWFSEGLAERVAQRVMASVDADAAAERLWRRAAVVASALHHNVAYPPSALATPVQWNDAAAAGQDRLIYAEALLTVDWLLERGGPGAAGRVLAAVASDKPFAAALDDVTGIRVTALDASIDAALRADLLPRFPVGIHVFAPAGPPGTRFQFAAVGVPPHEVLSREFVREDGHPARDSGPPAVAGPVGSAYWTFQTRPDSEPATWWVTVQGDHGTSARLSFRVTPAGDAPAGP